MAKKEQVQETVENQEQVSTEEQQVPESVSLNDLQLLANIVDLASQRGAFRGAELSQVGSVFDRLQKFLGFVAKQQEEREQAEAEASSEEAQS